MVLFTKISHIFSLLPCLSHLNQFQWNRIKNGLEPTNIRSDDVNQRLYFLLRPYVTALNLVQTKFKTVQDIYQW